MALNFFHRGGKKNKSELTTTRLYSSPPEYDFSKRKVLDTSTIRSIANNTHADYKLSASVLICGVKAIRDYVDAPVIKIDGSKKLSDKIKKGIDDIYITVHKKALFEGNFFIWSTFNSKKNRLEHVFFNYEDCDRSYFDIDTKELKAIRFRQRITYLDGQGNEKTTVRVKMFDENTITTTYDGDIPPGQKSYDLYVHNYGRLPLKYWTYGRDEGEIEGHGLTEPCEPYLAVLHDIILNRAIEDKRSSRKKYVITANDPQQWIDNTKTINGIAGDNDAPINLEDLDVFFNSYGEGGQKEEKTAYLQPGQSAADSIQIAKLAFMNIIEILRTPEWLFPPKLGASFASASVQVPAFIQLIDITRKEFSPQWVEQASIDAMVLGRASLTSEPDSITCSWNRITLENAELRAKIVNYMVASMKIAKESMLMDDEEIRDYINSFMGSLKDFTKFSEAKKAMLADLKKMKTAQGPARATPGAKGSSEGAINNENRTKKNK